MVIVRIVFDHSRHFGRRDQVRHAPQFADDDQWRQSGLGEAHGEFLAREYVEQFRQQHGAAAHFKCLSSCSVEQLAWRVACRDHAGDQRVGVEYNSHDQVRSIARAWRAA